MNRKSYPFFPNTLPANDTSDTARALVIAEEAARVGGKIIRERFGEASSIHWKRGIEAQTPADVETEKAITHLIASHFPHDTISGEELGTRAGTSLYTWVIDPLDGTSNFVLDIPQLAVCISLKDQTKILFTVIYQPMIDVLYIAQEGKGASVNGEKIRMQQRMASLSKSTVCSILTYEMHDEDQTYFVIDRLRRNARRLLDTWAPSLDWCLLATGKIDALVYLSNQPMWIDPGMLAGAFFFLEAGGYIGDLQGDTMTDITQFTSVIAASSPAMIQEVGRVIALDFPHKLFSQYPLKNIHSGALQISVEGHPPAFSHSFDVSL